VRLLLIAPTVDGQDVGEAWVAYQWVKHSALRHDVTLLTYRKRGRPAVAGQLPGVRVVEWEEPPLVGRAERLNSLLKPGYLPFYFRARRWVKRALADGEKFDIIHQPVPVAMRYPSPAIGLGLPVVVGPVGGGLASPPGFDAEDTAPWYVKLRRLDRMRLRGDPLLRRTYEQADCVLGIAPYVLTTLDQLNLKRFAVMGETALSELRPRVEHSQAVEAVRLLFVGRLIRTKGARDAIAALASLKDLNLVFDIVGDGFDRAACEELTDRLGLRSRVNFHGALPHDGVLDFYEHSDVFVFPSYREPGGNVVFEAMAACLPLIVADRGGPAYVVDDWCGIRVRPESPEQYASALAVAIRRLAEDSALRRTLGEGARRRVEEVGLWEPKVRTAEALYAELIVRAGR
jgi:glycosyltransferase involved in cell wall biosynthesis